MAQALQSLDQAALVAANAISFGFVDKVTPDTNTVTVHGRPCNVRHTVYRATRMYGIFPTIERQVDGAVLNVTYFWTVAGYGTVKLLTTERQGRLNAQLTWSKI